MRCESCSGQIPRPENLAQLAIWTGSTVSRPGKMHEYDLIADLYAADRESTAWPRGLPEVTSLASSLAPGARVLDIGCGTGVPLTRALLSLGCQVVGVDSSMRMLERFRVNCPSAPFIHGTIQSCDLDGMTFDAAIAWGVLFHLAHPEQEQAIARVSSSTTGPKYLANKHGSTTVGRLGRWNPN